MLEKSTSITELYVSEAEEQFIVLSVERTLVECVQALIYQVII